MVQIQFLSMLANWSVTRCMEGWGFTKMLTFYFHAIIPTLFAYFLALHSSIYLHL